ncbi:type II toxin-antitoxin system VapC family toxin [Pendulispora albinea]|uniref:Type II toxin-antitoxin system VapC family toxin n=1 Tax=Pendulispora albinea TaxID=2741071 RepID=A0ABZ2LRC5_9BACT
MKVLLDSHALVWSLTAPNLLSRKARAVVEDPETELYVSSASVWELFIKFHRGKLRGAESLMNGFDGHLVRLGAFELTIAHRHARLSATLPHPHRDPFDRMLAAQSIVEDLPIVTYDRQIAALGARTVW